MDELISKRAVIEAIEKARANVGHNLERSIGKSIIEILDDVGRDVDRLPSAHGTNLAEVGTDLISRQAAITALTFAKETGIMKCGELKGVIEVLNRLPSAHGTNLAEVGTDCISRQALLDKFEPWLKVKDYNDGELNMLKAILYEIRFMRSAQPETATVTIGRTKGSVTMWYECDACGEPIDICDCYCRKCGRKLKHE